MRKTTLRTLASLAALAVLSFPHATTPQTCVAPAARTLLGGAYADSVLNPPDQEDNQFFTAGGGYPNIFFLIDTSGSMVRLPPNGPPSTLQGAMPQTDVVGCGVDPEFGGTGTAPGIVAGTVLDLVESRVYHSPCGQTAWEDQPYQGHPSLATGVDYADIAKVCPYYTPSITAKTGDPGYDPDFYEDSDALSANSKPNLFPKNLVFHDSRFGDSDDGWTFTQVNPWERSNNNPGTIAEFCADQGGTLQNGKTREEICSSCLTKRGWYYDGTVSDWSAEFGDVKTPGLWYTGNYLGFFPPKFVIARRVVKNIIAEQSRIRMALGRFGTAHFVKVRDFNPSCQSVFNNGNWESNRTTYVNDVNSLSWGGGTPLAMSLFDVGRFYHSPDLPWFGNDWELNTNSYESDPSANQSAVCWSCQTSSVILLTDGVPSSGDGSTLPDAEASISTSNAGWYAGDVRTGILRPKVEDCPECYEFTGADADLNNLTKVAFYMHNYDLRKEAEGACGGNGRTLDGKGMPGKQVLDVYTVGFGTSGLAKADDILANAAKAGGGEFKSAQSASELAQAMKDVFKAINEKATSFSVATISTLQTTTGHSVIVPRFEPSRNPHWAGHLSRFELYSEFVNACTPDGVGDLDCDGLCASVFLTDKNGRFMSEDSTGFFVLTNNNLPHCSQTPQCVSKGRACGSITDESPRATPWWDAYEALKAMSWKDRFVWTVTDSNADGRLTSADRMIRLDTSDTTADALVPYLGLGAGGGVCDTLASKIQSAGDDATAQVVRASKRECAKSLIRWVLGADVLNEVGRKPAQGWPPPRPSPSAPPSATNLPDQDQLLDRAFKLGDIYHSSPVVVDAPLPSDGILCPNGLHNQCIDSLWRTPVRHVNDVNQYDLYAKSSTYKNRRKMIVVGANDGLLHAFNGGRWHANANDPVTTAVDESKAPFEGYYDRGEEDGPQELWAFLAPDLLGKIPSLVIEAEHHLFVDGTAMVRDVWVDGAANSLGGATKDGKKAASEFHTVAIVGERRGGNHYFALDITEATNLPSEAGDHGPKFLWIYPQPDDPESLRFGETYTDFLPMPPPIGPVRIRADSNAQSYGLADATNAPDMFVPEDPTAPVKYHELWVTMLPGGYDPSYLRGRGVHMVDVWRGKEVFDFSYPANGVASGFNDPRMFLQYPVAATPGMVMWGKTARRPTLGFENDGYFDTSTFGDTGGQLWVLRFNRPAILSAAGKATNWFGGRIFMNGRWTSLYTAGFCAADYGLPFFYITENTALPGSHIYRVYAGTGDRFNLLDTNGGSCGPDNPRACAQKGCAVSLPLANNSLTMTGVGTDGQGLTQNQCPTGTFAGTGFWTRTLDVATAAPTCGVTSSVRMEVSACPDATGATAFSKDVAVSCTPDADGDYGCTASKASLAGATPTYGELIDQTPNLSTRPQQLGMYVSVKVFEDAGVRTIFDTQDGAAIYDFYVTELRPLVSALGDPLTPTPGNWHWYTSTGVRPVLIDSAVDNPTVLADATSPAWAIFYNHGPTVTADDHTFNVNKLDERTSSVSSLFGMVTWNAMQTALSEATTVTAGCAQSKCQGAFRRLSYHYGADAISGGPSFTDSNGNPVRAFIRTRNVPPPGDQVTVFVNQQGQIAEGGAAAPPEGGAGVVGMSSAMDPIMQLGVTEVSRQLHDCRHFKPAGPTLTAAERAILTAKCK